MDAVIEMPDGSWIGVAIVLGMHEVEPAATKLLKLQKSLARNTTICTPARLMMICGMANTAYRGLNGVSVLPLTALNC